MSGSLSRADSFDSFLAECFSVPTSTIYGGSATELTCVSVVHCAADFNLSLLGPVDESESVAETTSVDDSSCSALCRDSMKHRVSEIEDLLGVHQFAFWRASPSAAIPLIVSLCRNELGLRVERADFTLVRVLDRRRYGVLLRVPTAVLKRQILAAKDILKLRGYLVDLAWVCVSGCDPQNGLCLEIFLNPFFFVYLY